MALTQISTGGVKNDAVTAGKIPANAVGSSEIADDAVDQGAIADEAVDEARLQISNAGSNGQFLQKQSGNTGGLTWATATTDTSDKASLSGCNFTGSVGINTSSPVRKLHVTADDTPVARFERDTSDGAIIEIRDTSNNTIASIGSESGDLEISAENSNNLRFAVGTSEKFRVGSSGQLGVGGATYGSSGQVLTSGGASAAPTWADAAGGGATPTVKTANYTAASGDMVVVNGTGLTITLPSGPSAGDFVKIRILGDRYCTVARNSQNINGSAEDLYVDVFDGCTTLTYADSTRGWLVGC